MSVSSRVAYTPLMSSLSTPAKFLLGCLGDSISVAFNAERPGDNPEHAWAAEHHAARLSGLFPELGIETLNAAFNGAQAADLRAQVDRLAPRAPDYVTLLIGANDLARWLAAGEYGHLLDALVDDVRAAVRRLIAAKPRVMILLVAVPDQSRVVHLLASRRFGAAAAPYLAALAESPQLKQLTRSYKERWLRVNGAFEALAAAFPGNVPSVSATATAAFSGDHLSPLDAYHPSVLGQKLLADLTWSQGFFPG